MGPLLVLKFMVSGCSSYLYLSQYVKNGYLAAIGAVLYTFSGFTFSNLFYNHFMDKYEALEYLIHRMFYKGIEHESNPQIIKHIFQTVSDNRDFFKSCYRITGQNGFEDLMSNVFKEIFRNVFSYLDVSRMDSRFTVDFLVDYYANDLLYFLKYWISHNFEPDVETYYAKIDVLFKNSIKELNIRYMDKS